MPLIRLLLGWLLVLGSTTTQAAPSSATADAAAPLVIGQRTVHVFRAASGLFSPAEREEAARHRIELAFAAPGAGWTSVKPTAQGLLVAIDERPLFYVLPGDARELAGETPEDLANQASRALQTAWREARERRDPKASLTALLSVGVASALLVVALTLTVRLSSLLRRRLVRPLLRWTEANAARHLGERTRRVIPVLADRLVLLMAWLLGLFTLFAYATYSLGQFVLTRPLSETLARSLLQLGSEALTAVAHAMPGMFVAAGIFLVAWIGTRLSTGFFDSVEARAAEGAWLNTHTAPATRRIVNALLWLFAFAMAYPYLPGSQTEAFKGLSVMVGLMVSIGASGVVGQVASGLILVYTYALKKGEYVRIQEHEGTVTELSLFVTRLRTGLGEEIAIPNALVLGNVTRNFSRLQNNAGRPGCVLGITVTIGYDTAWRQVHAMLNEAAATVPEILPDPAPYVVQTALSDFYVEYRLIVCVGTDVPATRAAVTSALHAAIQDSFNRHGVQIMSPHYVADPAEPKQVPVSGWHPPPARPETT